MQRGSSGETLGDFGVSWVTATSEADAAIWIQGGSAEMRFAFVVAHPHDSERFIAAECGPRELTATIMTAVCEYFYLTARGTSRGEVGTLLAKVNELNRAVTGASLAQDWTRARQLMTELRDAIQKLGKIGGSEVVKPVVDTLGDSAQAYEGTGFSEAWALSETAIEALQDIGEEAIPWIKKVAKDSRPAVRRTFKRALKMCGGKPWWQFW